MIFWYTHTDAVSTYQTLRDQPETTCDNKADGSAYWVPSMELPDGQVVTPAYQKNLLSDHQSGTVSAAPVPGGSRTAGGRSPRFGAQLAYHLLCANGKGYSNKGRGSLWAA